MAKRIQKTISIDTSIFLLIEEHKYKNKESNLSDAFNSYIKILLSEAEQKTQAIDTAKEIKELKSIISSLVEILSEKEVI